jgi:isochorismate synthase
MRGFQKLWYRKEIIETDSFDLVSVFEKLIQSYRMLLLLLVSSKNRFMDGTTPERLLKLRTKVFYMAEGHKKSLGLDEVIWQKKKMEEQFVTDFILNNLKNLTSE